MIKAFYFICADGFLLRFGRSLTLLVFIFAAVSVIARYDVQANDNWPQWRGPALDNRSDAVNVPIEFGMDKNLAWRFEMPGSGGASPIVWNDRVFITSVDGDDRIWLFCIATTGDELWRRQLEGKNTNSRDNANSASPSPCTDGTHVWANSTAGFLECFDFSGDRKWVVDLQKEYGRFDIQFGMTSTPILHKGVLYLQLIHGSMRDSEPSLGYVVAIDAANGKQIWMQERRTDGTRENKHSYASPIIYRDGAHEFLVTHGGDYAIGHSLEDGSEIWRCGGLNPPGRGYNPFLRFVASPVFADGMLIVPSAKNGPVLCLNTSLSDNVTDKEDAFFWKMPDGTPDVSTPLVANGLVFLTRETGALTVAKADNGEVTYSARLFAGNHRSSPVYAEGRVYVADRNGKILVFSAEAEPKLLATNDLNEETTASPAIVNGRVYIRTFDALYAFEHGSQE
ncbi:MAG TPA: PQQ-binding-like beta-propeller repeat protein [Pirellulaceae bacterium]|nr:PQQ-binding-like beta-propeller repeat protein [Pirellulaceae bacterium]HMO93530.1 PQQ-binding-like beta-propeller repeat protein [Pirellulaceae bacterium]HMP70358.1 PQQ-binding-like beta-propeller repeat protein [Pirellulaceae bacterium]